MANGGVRQRKCPAILSRAGGVRFFILQRWPLPKLFSALIRAAVRRAPTLMAAMGGTVGVTAVGMYGQGAIGWGLTPMPHSVDLVVGRIARKPAVVAERIEPREIRSLTVVFDHDVIDGSPATRFVRRLMELGKARWSARRAKGWCLAQVPRAGPEHAISVLSGRCPDP